MLLPTKQIFLLPLCHHVPDSNLRAPNRMLKCLPPVMLIRAEHEILWDEISEMGRNLADAGQEVIAV